MNLARVVDLHVAALPPAEAIGWEATRRALVGAIAADRTQRGLALYALRIEAAALALVDELRGTVPALH